MRLQGRFKLGSVKEPRVQVLEMPDAEDHLSMVIVLPSEDVGLGQVNLRAWAATAMRKGSVLEDHPCRKPEDLK